MNCPQDISAVILAILYRGLLAARAHGWSGEAAKAALDADHLHNLPNLLADYKWERLRYYWEVERPCYIERVAAEDRRYLEPEWQRLAVLVEQHRPKPA